MVLWVGDLLLFNLKDLNLLTSLEPIFVACAYFAAAGDIL